MAREIITLIAIVALALSLGCAKAPRDKFVTGSGDFCETFEKYQTLIHLGTKVALEEAGKLKALLIVNDSLDGIGTICAYRARVVERHGD
jgi:hypothetical protein